MYLHCGDKWPDTAPLEGYLPHHRNFTCFIVVDCLLVIPYLGNVSTDLHGCGSGQNRVTLGFAYTFPVR